MSTCRGPGDAALLVHGADGAVLESADACRVTVFDGELYDHAERRAELERAGHRFSSGSDAEVMRAACAQWGAGCLTRVAGAFALVVADLAARTLFLARDPFGLKALYCTPVGDGLAFASELTLLLDLAGHARRADARVLLRYLDHGVSDHGGPALVEGVFLVPPGHHVTFPLGGTAAFAPAPYWVPDRDAEVGMSFEDAAVRLRDLVRESVRLHLRGASHVGALLSGGLDSSSVVMALREAGGAGLDLHTFSYVPDAGAVSEEPWIDEVNRAAGAFAHKVRLGPASWTRDADRVFAAQEGPFGSLAVFAQYHLFGAAREAGIDAVLGGQGADELMGGYRSMWPYRMMSLLRQGEWSRALRFLRAGAGTPGGPGPGRLARATLGRMGPLGGLRRALRGRGRRDPVDLRWFRERGAERPDDWVPEGTHALREWLWHGVQAGGLPGLLRFEDRNAAAHGVMVRLPYLTTRLAEFALALPEDYLIAADGTGKSVMRAAMRGLVPAAVLDRRDKVGFAVPLGAWLRAVPGALEMLERSGTLPCIRGGVVAGLVRRVRSGVGLGTADTFLAWRLIGLAGSVRALGLILD